MSNNTLQEWIDAVDYMQKTADIFGKTDTGNVLKSLSDFLNRNQDELDEIIERNKRFDANLEAGLIGKTGLRIK